MAITIIKQPYVVTMSKHKLNVHEMRIMFRIIEAIQKDMHYGKQKYELQNHLFNYVISLPTRFLIPENSQNYSCAKKALRGLEQKVITIKGKDEKGEYITNSRLIMKSKYYLNNQIVEIQLDKDLLPSYLALANNYSKYILEVAFNSSTPYTMKLYQYISHWKDKSKINVSIKELREFLQLENKYKQSKDFRRYILESASRELKKKADVWFEIEEQIKTGRVVTDYTLKIYKKASCLKEKHENMLVIENTRKVLREIFKFKDHHMAQLDVIFARPDLAIPIREKIKAISEHMYKTKIKKLPAYVIKSLHNEFKEYFEKVID